MRLLASILFLVALSAEASFLRLAWDASTTDGCDYRLYAQAGTNIVRMETGTNLTASLDDITPGFWSFWATAINDKIESDPSNVLTVEVPHTPQGIRTLVVEYGTTITNWTEFFRVKFE